MRGEMRDGRRQRLVECAKTSFARRGYYGTSISEIVQEAGIARATFYQYFDNKQHIFQSILDSFLQDLHENIRPVALGPGAPPPLTQIEENLTRVLTLVLRERDLTQMLLHHGATLDPTAKQGLNDFYHQVAEMIERSLKMGIAMSFVRPCNTRLTSYSIIGAVKEVVFQLTPTQQRQPQPPVEELVQELLGFGMGGILADSKTSELGNAPGARSLGVPVHSTR